MTINAPGLNPLEVEGLPPVGDALNAATPFRRPTGLYGQRRTPRLHRDLLLPGEPAAHGSLDGDRRCERTLH